MQYSELKIWELKIIKNFMKLIYIRRVRKHLIV